MNEPNEVKDQEPEEGLREVEPARLADINGGSHFYPYPPIFGPIVGFRWTWTGALSIV